MNEMNDPITMNNFYDNLYLVVLNTKDQDDTVRAVCKMLIEVYDHLSVETFASRINWKVYGYCRCCETHTPMILNFSKHTGECLMCTDISRLDRTYDA